jgi:hypothetical protein
MKATWETDLFILVAIEYTELGDMLSYAWEDSDVEVWWYDSRKIKSV